MKKKLLIGILMLFTLAFSVSAHPLLYPISDKEVYESSTLSFEIQSTYSDYGTNTFTTDAIFGTLTKINETHAFFHWTPTYDDAGVYELKFSVSDDNSTNSIIITITVYNVNRAPTINLPASETLVQGFPETIAFTASDPDGDTLIYTVSDNESEVDCDVTGTDLTMTAATDFTGTASCTVEANDGDLTDSDTISITVQAQNPSVSIGEVNFGKVNLDSYTWQKSFTITNNGNLDLHNTDIVWDSAYDKYNIEIISVPSTLTVGSSDTAYVKIFIPADQSHGSLTIPVTFTSDELNKAFNLKADVLGRLIITDLDVKVDDKTDSNIQDKEDGYKIGEKAKPESRIQFSVRVENTFPEDGPKIEDVVVTITIEEIDMDDDLEEESEEFNLDPDDTKKVTLEFDVPLKVNEEDYSVIIEVEGEDEDGKEHKVVKTLYLEVDKETHDLRIKKTSISPMSTGPKKVMYLDVEIINIGSREEDEVVITVKSTALGIDLSERNIELSEDPDDEDNEYKKTFKINIPDTVASGIYSIEIRVYYDEDKLEDLERVQLTVYKCLENFDCGIDAYIGASYCFGNNVYRIYRTHICNNPETVNSYCSYEDTPILIQECKGSEICQDGGCIFENKLSIDKVKITYDGKSKTVHDGDSVRNIESDMDLKLKVYVKNVFTEDIEIEDVELTATIEGIDEGDDLEEESDEFDIKAGKTKSETLNFEIPLLVDEDTYDLTIEVEGEDENGTKHTTEATIELEVEKEKHKLTIYKAILEPKTSSCGEDTYLDLEVINLGSEDEEEVVITLVNDKLNLNKKEELELDSGDDEDTIFSQQYFIDIPEDLAVGTYPIEIKVYYDTDRLEDTKKVNLLVEECKELVEEEEKECKTGCLSKEKCYPKGTSGLKKNNLVYCDGTNWIPQKELNEICEFDYECEIDSCIDGICKEKVPTVKPLKKRKCFLFWCWYI